jgi:hypothetical protein
VYGEYRVGGVRVGGGVCRTGAWVTDGRVGARVVGVVRVVGVTVVDG